MVDIGSKIKDTLAEYGFGENGLKTEQLIGANIIKQYNEDIASALQYILNDMNVSIWPRAGGKVEITLDFGELEVYQNYDLREMLSNIDDELRGEIVRNIRKIANE